VETPTQPTTLKTVAGDTCADCGTPLAPDQRYCVNCGRRRGSARQPHFSSPVTAAGFSTAPAPPPAPLSPLPPLGPRASAGTTLVAGVLTLVVALGVGVLIGRSGDSKQNSTRAANQPVQVVTVPGAGSGTASTAATTTASDASTGSSTSSAKKAKSSKSTPKPATNKVKGTNLKLPAKSVVKVGQKGSGKGYKNGKFTGDFFGGG
jgi:hypothetical protein